MHTILCTVTLNSLMLQLSSVGGIIIQQHQYDHLIVCSPWNNLSVVLLTGSLNIRLTALYWCLWFFISYNNQNQIKSLESNDVIPEAQLCEFQVRGCCLEPSPKHSRTDSGTCKLGLSHSYSVN